MATVTHLHAVLRKAFRDAVIVDELIGSNPVERAKRPRAQAQSLARCGPSLSSGRSWATAQQHRLFAFFHVAAYTGARRGELLNLRWKDIDLDGKKITITGSTAVIGGERVNGTTKSGRTRVVSIDAETVAVLRQRKVDQAAEQLKAGDSWRGTKDGYVFTTGWGEPIYPDTVTSLMTKLIRATSSSPTHGCTTCGTCTPRHCCSQASRSTSSLPAWGTPTRLLPSVSTPRSLSAQPRPPPRTFSPVRSTQGYLLANPLARKPLPRSEKGL